MADHFKSALFSHRLLQYSKHLIFFPVCPKVLCKLFTGLWSGLLHFSKDKKISDDLKGKRIVFITDVIYHGYQTSTALNEIQNARGGCENVHCIFDFGFNLKAKGLQKVNIFSLLETNTLDLKDLEIIKDWKERSRHLLGKENRKDISQPAWG